LSSKFDKSGLVLQDIVNELGRRLEYSVENGLCQGKVNAIGHDGLSIALDTSSSGATPFKPEVHPVDVRCGTVWDRGLAGPRTFPVTYLETS
jgi:hypothetical protein